MANALSERDCLISCGDLHELIESGESSLKIIAVMPRWRHWLQRIPNSQVVQRSDLRDPVSQRLISPLKFQHWARRIGIDPDSRVVIVDEQYDATWLWWAFRRYGKSNVQVLDGGLKAWITQHLPLKYGPLRPVPMLMPGRFTAAIGADFPVADLAMVLASQHDSSMHLWDTRELHEWDGRICVRGAVRAGRIAWANHLHWNLFRHDGRFLSTFRTDSCIDRLVAERSISINKIHIFYCQSGVRTTTAIFSLYRRGWDPAKLFNYEGSWREWSAL